MSKIVYIIYGEALLKKNVSRAYAENRTLAPWLLKSIKAAVAAYMPWVDEVISIDKSYYKIYDDSDKSAHVFVNEHGSANKYNNIITEFWEPKTFAGYDDDTIFIAAPGNYIPVSKITKATFIKSSGLVEFGTVSETKTAAWKKLESYMMKDLSGKCFIPEDVFVFTKDALPKSKVQSFRYKIANNNGSEIPFNIISMLEVLQGAATNTATLSTSTTLDITGVKTLFAKIEPEALPSIIQNNAIDDAVLAQITTATTTA